MSWWMWMGAAGEAFLIDGVSYALLREAPYFRMNNVNKLNPWSKPSTKQRAQKWLGDTGNSVYNVTSKVTECVYNETTNAA